ncbi:MAG: amino acid permease [Verrucomicrobia bacterium]|nr:MAG: amino acid permease [Verrucomicrobiota bacterium]
MPARHLSHSTCKSLVGLPTAAALVVANMIGTGVFTSLGFQLKDFHSPFIIIMLWLLGGVFALCGALSYAELAGALPRSGGEYHFLGRIYHPALGFMAGMVSLVAGFSAPTALAAMAFGKYLQGIFPHIPPQGASLVLVTLVSVVHLVSIRMSGLFQTIVTIIKIALIATFLIMGFSLVQWEKPISFFPPPNAWQAIFSPAFAIALMFAMFSYSGWNAAVYIADEIQSPEKNVGKALLLGTAIVTVLYVLLNSVFLLTAPIPALEGQLDVGRIASKYLFGNFGGLLISGLICLSIVASVSAMTWAGPRVSAAMGTDHPPLHWLALRTSKGVPWLATVFQYALVVLLLLTTSFETVLIYAEFALVACCLLTSLGVIVLRHTQPDLPRPFQCWAYPLPPLLFCAISLLTLVYSAFKKPWESLASLTTLLILVIAYFPIHKFQVGTRAQRQ